MSNILTVTLDELLFTSIPSSARNTVIEASVTIERIVGTMLGMFLDIDCESSTSFGNTTQALSFNHKLNLLTDLKIIGKDEKTLLIHFSEIRNVFAHNAVVISFFQCFKQKNLRRNLEKKYGIQKSTNDFEEDNCELLFEHLYTDVKQICRDLFHKMMSRAGNKGEVQGTLMYHQCLLDSIEELSKIDLDFRFKIGEVQSRASEVFFEKIDNSKS